MEKPIYESGKEWKYQYCRVGSRRKRLDNTEKFG